MLDTFKARLKAKATASGAQNLTQVRIDAMAAALNQQHPDLDDEAEHDKIIDALNAVQPFKDIAAYDDYQRAKAAKEKKDKEKQQQQTEGGNQQQQHTDTQDDTPAWAKALLESNKALAEKVQNLEKEKTRTSITERVRNHEKLKDKVPVDFYDEWALPEKDEDIDPFVERVAAKWEKVKPAGIQTTKVAGGTAGGAGNKPSKEQVEAVLQKI